VIKDWHEICIFRVIHGPDLGSAVLGYTSQYLGP
jgi:hypothetical protein